ncbi:MAG: ribose 5-phosphate isomerase B [Proteobacteria bacterium]|jgi:ribose 5-phosphate isomerase B|nr:ribose 5-phosphate isomerase B [Pseudomonadota bacterium]
MTSTVIIGSDHRGLAMKAALKEFVRNLGMTVEDAGPFTDGPADYPEFAAKVARAVANGACDRGMLICGSGIGMSMTANKFRGIRAALCHDGETAKMCRLHNDANVLVMGEPVGIEQACQMARIWLETPFEGGRHQRRLDMIAAFEKENFK